MISRGIIIGKIVDDLASLKSQIETRNILGQFDLTKFCEDFIREVLNITYNLNLQNLNASRSNVPGIDLGDTSSRIAYQVTSQKTSQKITSTLTAITTSQKKEYDIINVFIIGKKQTSYSIDSKLLKKFSFDIDDNILDIDNVLRDIVILDIQKLEILFSLFKREFRQVSIELEPIDKDGNFASSYYNVIEVKPSSPPLNASKLIGDPDEPGYKSLKKEVLKVYERLASVPRVTREILAIIADRGKSGTDLFDGGKFSIIPEALAKFLNVDDREVFIEINILENAGLVYIDEDEVGERIVHFLYVNGEWLNHILYYMKNNNLSIRTLLNTMDFTILDT